MKKGTYYIGDPCYVFNESWGKVLEETDYFEKNKLFGKEICGGGTAYGDGSYSDNFGREYGVDAGLIACLPVSLLKVDKKAVVKGNVALYANMERTVIGHIVKFDKDFECAVNGGVFRFGDILIDTKDEPEEEEGECPYCHK